MKSGRMAMKLWQCSALACLTLLTVAAGPRGPSPTAIFPFSLDDTSLVGEMQGSNPAQQQRLHALDTQLRDALTRSGCCTVVDLSPVAQQVSEADLRQCNDCDVALARKVGAKISVFGWVQKVSNLILNINLVVHDVATGRVIAAGSVDIRGNTQESWSRGLSYLLSDRLHPSHW